MSRMLAILSTAGLVLCAAFLGLAFLIGGDDLFQNRRSLEGIKPLIDMATRKEWRWDGGDTLALNAPVHVRYQPKGPPRVAVTGPAELIKDVRVGEGRIASQSAPRNKGPQLDAVVSGVEIRKFVVNGGEKLELGKIEQDSLDVHLNGAGSVSGEGQVRELNLVIAGSGTADLARLSVTSEAKVSILGNGSAALSPKGDLRLFIAGSGRLALSSQPRSIKRTILGSGEVVMPSGHPLPPSHPAPPIIPAPLPNIDVDVDADVRIKTPNVLANPGAGDFMVRDSRTHDFGRIEREDAKIMVLSSGSAIAEGKVTNLTVNVMGSGAAQLGKLAARDVAVTVAGSGEAIIAPSGIAKITILGSGRVRLLTKPQRIERTITGSGRIIEAD